MQDHLLKSKNGDTKPNHRDEYLFGNSLPIKEADITNTVEKLVSDLSKRAGGGPTCKLTISGETAPAELTGRYRPPFAQVN